MKTDVKSNKHVFSVPPACSEELHEAFGGNFSSAELCKN